MSMHGAAVSPGANSAELQLNPGEKGKSTLAGSEKLSARKSGTEVSEVRAPQGRLSSTCRGTQVHL